MRAKTAQWPSLHITQCYRLNFSDFSFRLVVQTLALLLRSISSTLALAGTLKTKLPRSPFAGALCNTPYKLQCPYNLVMFRILHGQFLLIRLIQHWMQRTLHFEFC